MNMNCISIYLAILNFFLKFLYIFYSFQYTSLVLCAKFIPKYFILFDAIVNGIVHLTSLWIVHGNTI